MAEPPTGPPGRIDGRVVDESERGIGGVEVTLQPTGRTALTDGVGAFSFAGVPAGLYKVSFRSQGVDVAATEVTVQPGEVATLEQQIAGEFSFAETITVSAASRQRERLIEAPAAVTTVGEAESAVTGAPGQLPALLEFTAGAEVTQSGVYDYNLNIRGFNGFLNRRIQTLVDGRDPSIPETSGMEWWMLSLLSNDLADVELVRGPGSALYGANSINGVLSLTTRAPRDSQGGKLRLTLGELDTTMAELRWAGGLGRDWYMKMVGDHTESESFTQPRTDILEYPGLPRESVPLEPGGIHFDSGSLRLDKYRADGDLLTLEGGLATGAGETFVTQASRAQQTDVDRSWGRLAYGTLHWNLAASSDWRDGVAVSRNAGVPIYTQSRSSRIELQGNHEAMRGRVQLMGGLSYLNEAVDSADPNGLQTLYFEPIDTHEEAVFGQVSCDLSAQVRAVVAVRWDESTLHEAQVSPRAALLWSPTGRHTFRLSYDEGFQVGNYTELYLRLQAGLPVDLSAVENAFRPLLGGVSLGLGTVPIYALGNPDLKVEKIRSYELGYQGILGGDLFLTANYYRNELEDFISNLLPWANPAYGPYRAPSQLPPDVARSVESTLNGLVPGLTNGPGGAPWIVVSNTNTGRVESQGVELAMSYQPSPRWQWRLSGAWFDFDVREQTLGAEVSPNVPDLQAGLSAFYQNDRLGAMLGFRWVDGFDWVSGIFAGPVPSYQVVHLAATYAISRRWEVGLNVSNLLDDVHYEAFGGDLLARRALGHVSFSW